SEWYHKRGRGVGSSDQGRSQGFQRPKSPNTVGGFASPGYDASARYLKAGTQLAPVPVVMVSSAAENGALPNIVTVAWTGTICSDPAMLSISLRKSRYSHELISKSGEFVVNLVSRQLAEACDFCGVKSGREQNKWETLGLEAEKLEGLEIAPAIHASPLVLGCKLRQIIELGSHDLFIAEIVQVRAHAALFDAKNAMHLSRANLICYQHGEYHAVGELLGFFGYSLADEKTRARRFRALNA
ncbi:MAG: flavin reductase family protein, partial [Eubacteriales bacterium]|nr:flavin reductase family protein [Eubacteriales bacterium]